MPQDGRKGQKHTQTLVQSLCQPEKRDVKKLEVPAILLTAGELRLLFRCPVNILSCRMAWESVLNHLHIHTKEYLYICHKDKVFGVSNVVTFRF